jgi:hypothetical protein
MRRIPYGYFRPSKGRRSFFGPRDTLTPPTFDAFTTSPNNTTGSLSWSHTVGAGANRLLLVQVGNTGGADISATGVTFGGVPLTYVGKGVNTIGSGQRHVSLWALVNPSSGAGTVVATVGTASTSGAVATSYAGVNQASPLRTPFQWATNASVNLVSGNTTGGVLSDLVHAAVFARTTTDPVPGAGQTQRVVDVVSANARMIGSTQPGSFLPVASSFSWTTPDAGSMIAVAIRAAA